MVQVMTPNAHVDEIRFISIHMFSASICSTSHILKQFSKTCSVISRVSACYSSLLGFYDTNSEEYEWRDRPGDPKNRIEEIKITIKRVGCYHLRYFIKVNSRA